MKKCSVITLTLAGIVCFGFMKPADAEVYTAQWTSACSSDVEFTLDLQPIPNLESAGAFTLDGLGVVTDSTVPIYFPARGGAVYDPENEEYVVSLFYSNSIGVSFAYGARLDSATLSGNGSVLISSDLGSPASCGGTLAVVLP